MATANSLAENMPSVRYHKIITRTGKHVMAAMLKIYLEENSPATCHSLREQIECIGIYSNTKLKKEIQQQIDHEDLYDQDITFLFKILLAFYRHRPLPDKLKNLLQEIKNQRNAVSHEDLELTPEQLEVKLTVFHEILRETMNETENLYPGHSTTVATLRGKVDKDFKDIWKKVREKLDPTCSEDIRMYKEDIKNYGVLIQDHVQKESRNFLLVLLRRKCKTQPLDYLSTTSNTDPSNVSVSLMVDTEENTEENFSSSAGHKPPKIDLSNILKLTDPSGAKADVIIVSAEAGAGKTTLNRLIAEKYSKEENDDFPGLSDYHLLFYVEFRNRKLNSFDDVIRHNLSNVVTDYDFNTVKSSILRSHCLFLCDGYDERGKESLSVFEEILELQLSVKKILVTTRPLNTQDLTQMVNRSQNTRVNLSLLGMTEESIVQSIEKLVNHYIRDEDERKRKVARLTEALHSMAPETRQLTKNPLHNNMIFVLLMQCPNLITSIHTVTNLYEEMKKQELKRFADKLGNKSKGNAILQFQKVYNIHALKSLLENKDELGEEDVKFFENECKRLDLPFQDIMSTFFNTKFSMSSLDLEPSFYYKHRTEKEFAAALAICDILQNQTIDIHENKKENMIISCLKKEMPHIKDNSKDICEKLQNVLPFMSSTLVKLNLVDRCIASVIELLYLPGMGRNVVQLKDLLKLSLESNNNNKVIESIAKRLSKGRIYVWEIEGGIYSSSLPALLSKITPKLLRLDVPEDPKTLPYLKAALRDISSRRVDLELFLFHHQEKGSDYSDVYWDECKSLKSFYGYLSREKLSLLPDNLTWLNLKMTKEHLTQELLPSLGKISNLFLTIAYEEFPDDGRLFNHLQYAGRSLDITIEFEGQPGGDSVARSCALKINQLWPRVPSSKLPLPKKLWRLFHQGFTGDELRCERKDEIMLSNSRFSKSAVEEFINTLQMKSLDSIYIPDIVDISDGDKKRLKKLNKRKGFGELKIA